MRPKTLAKIAGLAAFGYLCAGAGAMAVIDHQYRRAAKRTTWTDA